MKTALLIATYNWPEALELVLLSVSKQSLAPDEIIIADDGSTNDTKLLIDSYSKKFNCSIKHIWQEDNGFQKTSILNKAIAECKSDYIIQIDGDIILHKHFIKDHIQNSEAGLFIHGSRAFLNAKITKEAFTNSTTSFSILQKGISNRLNMIYSPLLSKVISRKNNNLKGTRGCNFSFWKNDFILANGYNEDMTGWGKEDSELSARLINNNIKKLKLKHLAVSYHLHHNIFSRDGLNINNTILEETLDKKRKNCTNGISKYASGN